MLPCKSHGAYPVLILIDHKMKNDGQVKDADIGYVVQKGGVSFVVYDAKDNFVFHGEGGEINILKELALGFVRTVMVGIEYLPDDVAKPS